MSEPLEHKSMATEPRLRWPVLLLAVAAMALAASLAYLVWHAHAASRAEMAVPGSAPPAIPVETAVAALRDVPRYLTGIGTVQAFNTVTVKARVDGELQQVAFTEGQTVRAGDLLAQIDPRPFEAALNEALAKKSQDEASLANARLDLQRFAALAVKEFATRQQLDTQKALVAQLEATIRGDQASIDNARTQLGYTRITAPIAGRTGVRLVDRGNIVHATDATGIVVLTQIQPISVIFTLPEQMLDAVKTAMAAGPVPIFATARGGSGRLASGTLALIDNEIDTATGTIRLKGTFPNEDEALWPGTFVEVRLLADTYRRAVAVPSQAVLRGQNGLYTYVVRQDGAVEARPIEVEQIADGLAVIRAGVTPGETVVVAGQYRLRPGARVQATTIAGPTLSGARGTIGRSPP